MLALKLFVGKAHDDLPLLGEFGGVTHQIGQHLQELAGVDHQQRQLVVGQFGPQVDVALAALRPVGVDHLPDELLGVEGTGIEGIHPRIHLAEVEDVVNDAEQTAAGLAQNLDELQLIRPGVVFVEKVTRLEDGV